ncbi:MAG TPA: hypothetical protein VMY88_07395 [Acidimicrobiales bacterium]|nr:hypothetical protein [Acidimicrobiales bacterium]
MPESATRPQRGLHDPETINRESSRWIRAELLDQVAIGTGVSDKEVLRFQHAQNTRGGAVGSTCFNPAPRGRDEFRAGSGQGRETASDILRGRLAGVAAQ